MIWCYDPDGDNVHSGVVRIQDPKILKKMVEYMKNASENRKKFRHTIALIVSMNRLDGRENSYYISVYSYLAYILHCVEICDEVYGTDMQFTSEKEEKKQDQKAKQELLDLTEEYFPIRSCRRPEWQLRDSEEEVNSTVLLIGSTILLGESPKENVNNYGKTINHETASLMNDIVKWYKKLRAEQKKSLSLRDDITPHIMGDLWTKLYNYLQSISNLSPVRENKQRANKRKTNKFGKSESDIFQYIKVFNTVAIIFSGYMKYRPHAVLPIVSTYQKMIYDFPLTKYFNLNGIFIDSKKRSKSK